MRAGFRLRARSFAARRFRSARHPNLLIPGPTSTLQVFQFIKSLPAFAQCGLRCEEGCMGRFRSGKLRLAVAILVLGGIAGCGGGKKNTPLFPGKITMNPAGSDSLVLGGTLSFSAFAQTSGGTNLAVPITFSSSDTSVVNMSPTGIACGGHWDATFTICTPGGTGVAQVTASTLGSTSIPTYIFVHAPIDNITVRGILLDGVPVQEPCLSQGQSMTLEAHAYSQGTDITSSVGPFNWSANNTSVVKLTPLVNLAYNFSTNQVTATAANPGITNIYATASGVSSTSFQQAQYTNSQATTSPMLDFFASCPVQSISLELGAAGSGQTSFVESKGGAQTVVATVTDVMGNSTLPNTNGAVVLTKIPLTWSASQPAALNVSNDCTNTCGLSSPAPGAGTITASCSPPTCNIGFPTVPATLATPQQLTACSQFFQAQYPQFAGCQELIPAPVYATPVLVTSSGNVALTPPTGAISGVINGTTSPPSVLAASLGCSHEPPATCSTSIYHFSSGSAGNENPLPADPNSFLFDLAGDRVYMGSDFEAVTITPTSLGTGNGAYGSLGTVTGKVLAVSRNGTMAAFSDTLHTPNQLYIAGNSGTTALSIPAASAAAFSPDGLKAYILGNSGSSLYAYSPLQALQGPIALSGTGNAVAFSPNGAFAFIAEASSGGGSANLTAVSTCNNQIGGTIPLPANPLLMRVLPNGHIDGKDSSGNLIPDGVHILLLDSTGFDLITATVSAPAPGTLCPQGFAFDAMHPLERIELGEGTIQPVNFFASSDASQLYVVSASSASVLVYNFISGAVIGGIELLGNALPLSADMPADGGTIVVAGSDGMVHEISTALGGSDMLQVSFPNLPDYLNPFCTFTPSSGPCTLTTVLVKP